MVFRSCGYQGNDIGIAFRFIGIAFRFIGIAFRFIGIAFLPPLGDWLLAQVSGR